VYKLFPLPENLLLTAYPARLRLHIRPHALRSSSSFTPLPLRNHDLFPHRLRNHQHALHFPTHNPRRPSGHPLSKSPSTFSPRGTFHPNSCPCFSSLCPPSQLPAFHRHFFCRRRHRLRPRSPRLGYGFARQGSFFPELASLGV